MILGNISRLFNNNIYNMCNKLIIDRENRNNYRNGTFNNRYIVWNCIPMDIEILANFPKLRRLSIEINSNTNDVVIIDLSSIQSITHLDIVVQDDRLNNAVNIDLSWIHLMKNLRHLALHKLSRNIIENNIDYINRCVNLKTLIVASYFYVDSVFKNIDKLINLESLCVYGNLENNEYAQRIELLPKLVSYSGNFHEVTRLMPSIKKLSISLNIKNSNFSESLRMFPNIKSLRIISNDLMSFDSDYGLMKYDADYDNTDNFINIDFLESMPKLESLNILATNIKNFDYISKLVRLKNLEIKIKGTMNTSFLNSFHHLKKLNIDGLEIDNIDFIKNAPNIRHLKLEGQIKCDIVIGKTIFDNLKQLSKPISLKPLVHCKNLQTIEIRELTLDDLNILSEIPRLTKLCLECCGDYHFQFDNIRLENLEKLKINTHHKLDTGLLDVPNLRILYANNPYFHSDVIKAPNVKYVYLNGKECHLNFDNMKKITDLSIQCDDLVTEGTIESLSDLKSIRLFNIHNMNNMKLASSSAKIIQILFCDLKTSHSKSFPFNMFPLAEELDICDSNIESVDGIDICQNIKSLRIVGNNIRDLRPICKLANLVIFSCDTILLDHQDPRTFRILSRFIHRNDNHIYYEKQNVHDTSIQLSIVKSVENILKDPPVKYDPEKIIQSNLPPKTVSLLLEFCDDKNIHSKLDITFYELFAYVWARIERHVEKDELLNILAQQMNDAECKCFVGRFSRLISVLMGFYDDIEINISDSNRISAIVINTQKNIVPYDAEKHRELAQKVLEEAGYAYEQVEVWLDAITSTDD